MKFYVPIIIDCVFSSFISFVLSLMLFNYVVGQPYAAVISITVAALCGVISFKLLLKSGKKTQLKKNEKEEMERVITQFDFSSQTENNEFFYKLFQSEGYSVEKKKGGIFFKDKQAAVFIKFGFTDVNKSDAVKIFNLLKKEETGYIVSENFTADIKNFIERFNGKLIAVDGETIFRYLKENNGLPEIKYRFEENKAKGLKLFKNLLYKNKAKNYLVFGLVFLFLSYFFTYKLYYVIAGVLFLIAALFSRLFGLSSDE